jgi:hypothetical protein
MNITTPVMIAVGSSAAAAGLANKDKVLGNQIRKHLQ